MTNQTQRGSILTDIRSLEHLAYPTARAHPSVRMPALCAPIIVVEPPQPRSGAVLIDAPDCAAVSRHVGGCPNGLEIYSAL
jgi:hypothetical protein